MAARRMKNEKRYFVYIMSSLSRTLYTGVIGDLERRVNEHKSAAGGFTARYKVNRLVYFEETGYVGAAIASEKQIKGLSRLKKFALIELSNPGWNDLSADSKNSDTDSNEARDSSLRGLRSE
jgi:putative endonuclease